jgi:hypothetical protein
MPRGTNGTKCIGQFTGNDRIGSGHRSTSSSEGRLPSETIDEGVCVQVAISGATCGYVFDQLIGQTT